MALPICLLVGYVMLNFLFSAHLVYFYEGSTSVWNHDCRGPGSERKSFRLAIAHHDPLHMHTTHCRFTSTSRTDRRLAVTIPRSA